MNGICDLCLLIPTFQPLAEYGTALLMFYSKYCLCTVAVMYQQDVYEN